MQKDVDLMKMRFMRAVMESVYPLHFLAALKPFRVADSATLQVLTRSTT